MAKRRITATFTVDEDLWKISKYKLPEGRSKFLENCLRKVVYSENEIETLQKEIALEEKDLIAKKEKLEELENFREANSSNEESIKRAMIIVYNIVNAHDSISEAEIIYIAEGNFIKPEVLTEVIKKEGIKITKFRAEEKETTVKKSKTIF